MYPSATPRGEDKQDLKKKKKKNYPSELEDADSAWYLLYNSTVS